MAFSKQLTVTEARLVLLATATALADGNSGVSPQPGILYMDGHLWTVTRYVAWYMANHAEAPFTSDERCASYYRNAEGLAEDFTLVVRYNA